MPGGRIYRQIEDCCTRIDRAQSRAAPHIQHRYLPIISERRVETLARDVDRQVCRAGTNRDRLPDSAAPPIQHQDAPRCRAGHIHLPAGAERQLAGAIRQALANCRAEQPVGAQIDRH